MSLLLELPKLPSRSGAHGNARHAHWAQRARTVREEQYAWACLLMVALDQLGLWGSATRQAEWHFLSARVDVTFVFRMDRRRDRDNYAAALKPLWDAVVQVGILPDDDSEHLSIGGLEIEVDKARAPLTVLRIKPRELVEVCDKENRT